MKITSIKTMVVDAHRANFVFVRVFTDAGVSGIGEATLEHKELSVASAVDMLEDSLIGEDPFRVEYLIGRLHRDSYWRTGPVLRSALAGVEAALMDIKGKALEVPVYELLGGLQKDRIQTYGNAWFVGARRPSEFAEKAKAVVERGTSALKWDPFHSSYMTVTREERIRAIECVDAVRAAVGPEIELMIEGHGRFDKTTAIAFARDLVRFDIKWFEEPMPPEWMTALADVRRKSPIPIAAGERYYHPQQFMELITLDAVDYLQPDVTHVGGLTELKKICALAETRGIPVCPHNPTGPVANAMTLQVAAAQSNVTLLETMMTDVAWRSAISRETARLSGDQMIISDAVGLGVEVFDDACIDYPYTPRGLRHYTGELTDIRPTAVTAAQ